MCGGGRGLRSVCAGVSPGAPGERIWTAAENRVPGPCSSGWGLSGSVRPPPPLLILLLDPAHYSHSFLGPSLTSLIFHFKKLNKTRKEKGPVASTCAAPSAAPACPEFTTANLPALLGGLHHESTAQPALCWLMGRLAAAWRCPRRAPTGEMTAVYSSWGQELGKMAGGHTGPALAS